MKWLNKWDDRPHRQRCAKAVMSVVFGAAIREGYIDRNFIPEIKLKKLKRVEKRKVKLWTEENIDIFVAECDRRGLFSLGSMVLTGIETAQRRGDIIHMRCGVDYKEGKLKYVQSKTGATVMFNATKKLKARLDKYPSGQMFMFIYEKTGKPWDADYMTHTMREICDALDMKGFIFKHLRHSQITYLFELGLSKNVIRAISGHSESSIDLVLDNHYLESRSEKLANEGIARIDQVRQKSQTKSQTKK